MIYTERSGASSTGAPVGGTVGSTSGTGLWPENHDPSRSSCWSPNLNGPAGVYNYCFVDGHVETRRFDDVRMLGPNGTVDAPGGAWTVADGD